MEDSLQTDMMELTSLKEEPPDDGYEVQPQYTCSSLPGEEIITDDIPFEETLPPVPLKLVEVSTGKEVHYQPAYIAGEMGALSDPLQETGEPVPLKLLEASTGIEVHYQPNFSSPDMAEVSNSNQMESMAVKEEPPDDYEMESMAVKEEPQDDFEVEIEEPYVTVKQEPEYSVTDGDNSNEMRYSPLHLIQTSFGNDILPQMNFSLERLKLKMARILKGDQNKTRNKEGDVPQGRLKEGPNKPKVGRKRQKKAAKGTERQRNMQKKAAERQKKVPKRKREEERLEVEKLLLRERRREMRRQSIERKKQIKLERSRMYYQKKKEMETPEQRERRLLRTKEHMKRKRLMETAEEREERLQKMRISASARRRSKYPRKRQPSGDGGVEEPEIGRSTVRETEEQRQLRVEKEIQRNNERIARETEEERDERLRKMRERARLRRMEEKDEQGLRHTRTNEEMDETSTTEEEKEQWNITTTGTSGGRAERLKGEMEDNLEEAQLSRQLNMTTTGTSGGSAERLVGEIEDNPEEAQLRNAEGRARGIEQLKEIHVKRLINETKDKRGEEDVIKSMTQSNETVINNEQ